MRYCFACLILGLCLGLSASGAQPDVVIADFEGQGYGAWNVEGEALGPGPAKGTLPRQGNVTGFEGRGLVNTYYQGDRTTGKLTSPEFTISRRYLAFLIGGGGFAQKTCINLLVGGEVVRTATGPNTESGGSEALAPASWDVGDQAGKKARIEIVDQATGGWGHVNVDQIVLTDKKPPALLADQTREVVLGGRYLLLPIKYGATKHKLSILVDGQLACDYDVEPADGETDYWFPLDVAPWKGRKVVLRMDSVREGSKFLASIRAADAAPVDENLYHEAYRPQFHFSPKTGWNNDPNGLMYYQGEYHLFFQHNPVSTKWGNMTWGHAVSRDLVRWNELDDALRPDRLGTIYSGSGVVDHQNTTGFQRGDEKPLVAIYTSAGGTSLLSRDQPYTQSIAFSVDRGRTWTTYDKNPVLGNVNKTNRDPKVFWHAPTRQWVMILYLADPDKFALFGSPDLKSWTKLSDLEFPGGHECPDLFELAVDGDRANTRWVAWHAGGTYLIGRFNSRTFSAESGPYKAQYGSGDYAAQTYSDIPAEDGRRIQIAWLRGGQYPGMPFNQQMTVPRVLTLRTTREGIRLCSEPVKELETLRSEPRNWTNITLKPGENPLEGLAGDLWDIEAEIAPESAARVGFDIRGQEVVYSAAEKQLTALGRSAPLEPIDGRIRLRILVDRTSVEVFAQGGMVQMASCFPSPPEGWGLRVFAEGGRAGLVSLKVYKMRSIWGRDGFDP